MKIAPIVLAVSVALSAPSYGLIIDSRVSTSVNVSIVGEDAAQQTVSDGPAASATSSIVIEGTYRDGTAAGNASADDLGHSSLFSHAGPAYSGGIVQNVHVESQVRQSAIITNDSAVEQNIDFNFLIASGGFSFDYGNAAVFNAGYSADIYVNNNRVWFSNGLFTVSPAVGGEWWETQHSLTLGGQILNPHDTMGSINGYYWDAYASQLNLGVLNPGASLTLDYNLRTIAETFMDRQGYSYTGINASIGDPFDFNSTPVFAPEQFVTTVVPSVPEPETVAMYGVGLAALAFRRKSRKAKA